MIHVVFFIFPFLLFLLCFFVIIFLFLPLFFFIPQIHSIIFKSSAFFFRKLSSVYTSRFSFSSFVLLCHGIFVQKSKSSCLFNLFPSFFREFLSTFFSSLFYSAPFVLLRLPNTLFTSVFSFHPFFSSAFKNSLQVFFKITFERHFYFYQILC